MSSGAQGAFQGAANGGGPLMFDPTKYNAPSFNPPGFQQPPVPPPAATASPTQQQPFPEHPQQQPQQQPQVDQSQQEQQQVYQNHENYGYQGYAEGQYNYWSGYDYNYAMNANQGYDYNQHYQDYYQQQQHIPEAHQNGNAGAEIEASSMQQQRPDLVAAAPQDPALEEEAGVAPSLAPPQQPPVPVLPPPPSSHAPPTAAAAPLAQAPPPLQDANFAFGPDVIANNHGEAEAPLDPEGAPAQLEQAQEATEHLQPAAYPYYDHRPPDILNNEHPFMVPQAGDREPVDGGNDANNAVDNLPMHRLVLGESEPISSRFITGGHGQERSEAAGSEVTAPPPPPMMSVERSEAAGSDSHPPIAAPQPPLPEERSEAAGSASFVPPPPQVQSTPAPIPPPPVVTIPSMPEERIAAVGSDSLQPNIPPPPTIISSVERSEAAGADSAPPPPVVTTNISPVVPAHATSEERSEAAGSDRREIPPNPTNLAPPAAANVAPPVGRNVTGSDNKSSRSARRRPTDSEEDESIFSRDSEKRSHKSNKPRRGGSPDQRRHHRRRRSPSPLQSRSSSPSEEESYRSRGHHNSSRRSEKEYRQRPRRGDETSQRKHHHRRPTHDESSRYYDDRRSEPRDHRRSNRDSYNSRPSSRQGYPGYYDYSYYYPPHPAPGPAAAPTPDPKTLEIFKKNWEYYSRNPQEMENLRMTNPTQHANLFRYYQMYGHLLPSIQVSTDRPASRTGSIKGSTTASFNSQFNVKGEESTILHTTNATEPNYQPTPEVSAIQEEAVESIKEQEVIEEESDEIKHRRMTPVKFCIPHVNGIFGPHGNLIKIDAKSPIDGQTATLEMHSLKHLMYRQPAYKELHSFPGPLVPGRTHKGEVIQFCQNKIQALQKSKEKSGDKDSQILMWDLMILLLRQKNTIDGSDIAELLLKNRDVHRPYMSLNNNSVKAATAESKGDEDTKSNESYNTSDIEQETDSVEGFVKVTSKIMSSEQEMLKHTAKFRDYLLFGHKKEGLEYAMTHGLWGHALFLASKMDERSYSQVMLRFANGLVVNDPLQTLYQLMSGRQPIAVKECADANWGDWRPHLAMILSNADGNEGLKSIMTLGDTLSERGFLWAAQFCYLMANKEFGTYDNKSSKIVLIGGDRSLPFESFASNEAIQLTEIFEYVQKLSNADHVQHSFLYYKFLYAIRLLDHGLNSVALHYLEELAQVLVKNPYQLEEDIRGVLHQVLYLADKLKFLDPMYTTREGEISEMGDPQWLLDLRSMVEQAAQGQYSPQHNQQSQETPWQGVDEQGRVYYYDAATNSYYYPEESKSNNNEAELQAEVKEPEEAQTPSIAEEVRRESITEPPKVENQPIPTLNPQLSVDSRRESESSNQAPPPPMMMPPPMQAPPISALTPPTPPAMSGFQGAPPPLVKRPSLDAVPPTTSQEPANKPAQAPPQKNVNNNNTKKPATAGKENSSGPGLFGRILGKIGVLPPNQAHLPDDKENTIVWDEDKKRWVDKNATEEDESANNSAPPSDLDLSRNNSTANFAESHQAAAAPPGPPNTLMPPMAGGNKFAGGLSKKRGALGRVDVFKNSMSSPALSANMPPPSELFAPVAPITGAPPPPEDEPVTPVNAAPAAAAPSADGAPVFFNPASLTGPAPTTRRNKYA